MSAAINQRVSIVVSRPTMDRAEAILRDRTQAAMEAGKPSTALPNRSEVLREAIDIGLSAMANSFSVTITERNPGYP